MDTYLLYKGNIIIKANRSLKIIQAAKDEYIEDAENKEEEALYYIKHI